VARLRALRVAPGAAQHPFKTCLISLWEVNSVSVVITAFIITVVGTVIVVEVVVVVVVVVVAVLVVM
jgi:hypothetical protein